MGGCRCSYKSCRSATKTTENIHFFHYPVKHTERCRKWIENACKPHFFDLAEDQLRNKVVCGLHFEERCFTNISRRRLLHDAIPTLDGGCEDERSQRLEYQNQTQIHEIQVLPANEDGTLFTVDTDSFQQIPVSEKIESYIYNNGALVPLYKSDATNGTQNVMYALNTSNQEDVVTKSRNGTGSFGNSIKQSSVPRTYRLLFDTFTESEDAESMLIDDETSNCTVDSNTEKKRNSNSVKLEMIEDDEKTARKGFNVVNKKVVQRVKQHSKDIAFIKKTLKSTLVHNHQKCKKVALNSLGSRLPPTLFSLVRRSVEKDKTNITEQELELFKEIYSASPDLYKNLKEKYGWCLPENKLFCEA